jgi:signal transduction histidine kinase/CheY-like chemotaxis protein
MEDSGTGKRKVDWPFWAMSFFALGLLFLGLLFRVAPGVPVSMGIELDRGLIAPRYLDLVGVVLVLGFVYAGVKRREIARLTELIRERDLRARESARRIEELSLIFEVSSGIGAFKDVEEALAFVARTVKECLGADRASVLMLDSDTLTVRAAAGRDAATIEGTKTRLGGGIAGWVGLHHRPLLLNSRRDVEAFFPSGSPERDISSALCVPMILGGETLGVLTASRFPEEGHGSFEERHLKLVSIFADYAANAIGNLRMVRDLTGAHARIERSFRQLKQTQDQLIHTEKMAAIGLLISEVSHELNNPLTTTVGYAQLLRRVNRDPEMEEYLDAICSEGLRCQKIIGSLLDFARRNRGERSPVDVNQTILATVKLRGYQLGIDSVSVETDFAPDLPLVMADPNRLQQVFLNLLNNARDAIASRGGGGIVRFETAAAGDDERVVVRVLDNGPGLPEGLEDRIFEPFYTTKQPGEGTGLGLSICRGILDELRGSIAASRAPGGGACFRVELPVAAVEGYHLPGTDGVSAVEPVKGRRILVVDDEERIRDLLTRTLALDEHVVTAAASAPEALEHLKNGAFDLVLSDIMMPGVSGIDLYREIESRHRPLANRMIFFTGAAPREEHLDFFARTGLPCLHKPFHLDEVRRTISLALSRRRAVAGGESRVPAGLGDELAGAGVVREDDGARAVAGARAGASTAR